MVRMMGVLMAVFAVAAHATCHDHNGTADGLVFKKFLSCYAPWITDLSTDPNSYLEGCDEANVSYCRTNIEQDVFCKFDGTNALIVSSEKPPCWYSCGMLTCDAWVEPHTDLQKKCVAELRTWWGGSVSWGGPGGGGSVSWGAPPAPPQTEPAPIPCPTHEPSKKRFLRKA